MKLLLTGLLILFSISISAQHFDAPLSQEQMEKDLKIFWDIRKSVNSGLYKYRTKAEIDSVYSWSYRQIQQSKSLGDFYNTLVKITGFEGSLHNETYLPDDVYRSFNQEGDTFFPYPLKIIKGQLVCNISEKEIPLGATILSINGIPSAQLIRDLGVYYTTDGYVVSAQKEGINMSFSKYFRFVYGAFPEFSVQYRLTKSSSVNTLNVKAISRKEAWKHYTRRHSFPFDSIYYSRSISDLLNKQSYELDMLSDSTAYMRISSFLIGFNAKDSRHIAYKEFLKESFETLKAKKIHHLIIDVRANTGGTDPNDSETWSYLIDRPLKDVKQAFVISNKLPFVSKLDVKWYQKPFVNIAVRKEVKKNMASDFTDGKLMYDQFKLIKPQPDRFTGEVYLLVGPRTASAGSMFAAMVAGNTDAVIIGEETGGGYYGHNGVFPVTYILPESKIKFDLSIVNLDQNVPIKDNQPPGSGIIPHHQVEQSLEDFMTNEDTALQYTLDLIKTRGNSLSRK